LPEIARTRTTLRECMENFLYVVVLLEAVDELENIFGRILGKLDRCERNVFGLGGDRLDAAVFERFLQAAEVGKRAADENLRIAVRIGAASLDGDDDFLADARKGLRHAVPAREHRMFSGLEDASHSRARLSQQTSFPTEPHGDCTWPERSGLRASTMFVAAGT